MKNVKAKIILQNNSFTITVPGQPYLLDRFSGIGTNINLDFALPTVNSSTENNIDKERSGKFLICRTKHSFQNGIYPCSRRIDVHILYD